MNAEQSNSIRAMYDHSVDRSVEAVGTTLNPEFETDAELSNETSPQAFLIAHRA